MRTSPESIQPTPGPWRVVETQSYSGRRYDYHVYGDEHFANGDRTEHLIATVIRGAGDAHLIAAAPDLRAALKAIVALLDRQREEHDSAVGLLPSNTGEGPIAKRARAAIAKAEGR